MALADSASFLAEMAIAEEAVAGTAATTPVKYDYFTGDPAINPVQNVISAGGLYRREQMKHAYGAYHITASIPQMVEPEGAIGWWLKWGIGSPVSAQVGTTDAYTHTYEPDNALKSFTLWYKRGSTQTVKVPYCVVNTLELSQAVDDALRCNVGIIGQKDLIAADFGTSSYSTLNPFMNSHLSVSIAGSTAGQAAQAHNTSIMIENGFNHQSGRVHGSRFYSALIPNKRRITGTVDLYFNDDSEYQRFWESATATAPGDEPGTTALIFDWDSGVEAGSAGETIYNHSLKVTIPSVVYTTTSVNVGGDRVVQSVSFEAEYDSTAENDIEVELQNTITAYADAVAE